MVVVKLVGSIVKFGVTRRVSGEKEKTIVFAVHGSVENIDFLMDKPLSHPSNTAPSPPPTTYTRPL
jgi:hypothetical protein